MERGRVVFVGDTKKGRRETELSTDLPEKSLCSVNTLKKKKKHNKNKKVSWRSKKERGSLKADDEREGLYIYQFLPFSPN